MGRRRRRRRGGFFRRLGRAVGRVVGGVAKAVGKVVGTVAKVVTTPIQAVANAVTGGSRRRGGHWGAAIGDKRGGGFVRVEGDGDIKLHINPQPAEMGDKLDIDWDNTDLTKDKMFQIHIHRLAGPIPEPKRGKEKKS
tara:strand:- start:749 stop:1162 length:414 start_codon:yes stop_codon:yes gene_type:complete